MTEKGTLTKEGDVEAEVPRAGVERLPGRELQNGPVRDRLGSHQQIDGQRRDDNMKGEGAEKALRKQRRLPFSLH